MRILITSIVDLTRAAHNRLYEFIKHLSLNHHITVISISDWWKAKQVNPQIYSECFENTLQNIRLEYFTQRRISPIWQEAISGILLGKLLKEINYKYFDVHFNYGTLVSGYFVARKLKSAGINMVYDIADDIPQMIRNSPQIPPGLRLLGGLVGNIMVSRNINLSRKTVCTTDSLRELYHIPKDKFELIPNGVDTELFKRGASQPLRNELGIDTDFVVGYVGVLREWVDLEPVFSALSQLGQNYSNIKMLVVGEEGRFQQNKQLAQKYGLSDRVIFTGTVPYTQVPEYISCMDVCLVPFKANAVSEGALPLKLFEYMACEKPVICSKLTGVTQAVGDRVLYASNEKGYRDNLVALYSNRQLREKMGAEGRVFVKQNYSWASITSKLEEVLNIVRGGQP